MTTATAAAVDATVDAVETAAVKAPTKGKAVKAPSKPGKAPKTPKVSDNPPAGRKPGKGQPGAKAGKPVGKGKGKPPVAPVPSTRAGQASLPTEREPLPGMTKAGRVAGVQQAINPHNLAYRGKVYGLSVAAVLRALGANGCTWQRARVIADKLGLAVLDSTIKCQVSSGAAHAAGGTAHHGAPPDMPRGEIKALLALAPDA